MDIARGDIANYFANEAITRFANDPIGIGRERERGIATKGSPGKLPCVDPAPTGPSGKRLSMNGQRYPRRAAGNTNATTRGSGGAYIPCGLTAARRDIGAAHQEPGGQVASAVEAAPPLPAPTKFSILVSKEAFSAKICGKPDDEKAARSYKAIFAIHPLQKIPFGLVLDMLKPAVYRCRLSKTGAVGAALDVMKAFPRSAARCRTHCYLPT